MSETSIPKSAFANIDARLRCLTDDCWGDLLLFPTGAQDEEGVPSFHPLTMCPLCGTRYPIDDDMTDRDLFLRISWLRANPWDADEPTP